MVSLVLVGGPLFVDDDEVSASIDEDVTLVGSLPFLVGSIVSLAMRERERTT